MRILKAVVLVAVLTSALTLGACQQRKESMATTNTSAGTTRSYSK